MIELFVSAFFLGLLFNAMPGAVFAESLRRGLRGGFGPAFAVQAGSLAGDLVWAVLGVLGAAALFPPPPGAWPPRARGRLRAGLRGPGGLARGRPRLGRPGAPGGGRALRPPRRAGAA